MPQTVLPEPGQLVKIRQRPYVVTDVIGANLPADILRTPIPDSTLVTLTSVDDDGLGEELQVIWEIEPGATIIEKARLPHPKGFDPPEYLDAFLDAVRWGASSSADIKTIQAPFFSGIELEDYQLDPVVRAIQMPRVNLLIADDVGLGKTIEAGLVAQELILRHRCQTILIVCPSSLQLQWRDQMRDKFGLEFRIIDSDLIKKLRRERGLTINPWGHFPRLITSIDFLKRERPLRQLRELLPPDGQPTYPRKFDLLILDEAHNVAPSGGSTQQYARPSQRTQALRELAPHFEHKLFLSATPHNGYRESFTALLELLDNQRFVRGADFDEKQLRQIMVRRLKSEILNFDGTPRFPKRLLVPIEVDYNQAEQQAHQQLEQYRQLRCQGASNAQETQASEFVLKLLKKRLFSSPQAFLTTLQKHRETVNKPPQARPSRPASILKQEIEALTEDYDNDQAYDELLDDALTTGTRYFRPLSPAESQILDQLEAWASSAAGGIDQKAQELLTWLETTLRPNGVWNQERVIIFTEYRATQKWLLELFSRHGFTAGDRVGLIYGGMVNEEREQVKAGFQTDPTQAPIRILLATDAASEGLDLQNHCHRLIHYEIPWNPNRMEQRNGRVDRHGQQNHEVLIYHFVGQGFQGQVNQSTRPGDLIGDLEFLFRAAQKVDHIREDLGKVGPVIASQVEEAMLGVRSRLDTNQAEAAAQPLRKLLKFERDLRERIEKLRLHLQDSRETLRLTPENLAQVIQIGLQLAGQPRLIPVNHPELGAGVYQVPGLVGSWGRCLEGLAHPFTQQQRPIVFDPDLARNRDDVVLVHLNHRLAQMTLRLLRAEVWQETSQLHRFSSRTLPRSAGYAHPIAVAYGRLVVTGTDHQRLLEEVVVAGGALREGQFERLGVRDLQKAISLSQPQASPKSLQERIAASWDKFADPLQKALEARVKDRQQSLQKELQERGEKEANDIAQILQELQRTIEAELDEPQALQLSLLPDDQATLERDLQVMRRRLEQIPAEIEREQAAIYRRYAQLTPRLFPLAVTILCPAQLS